MFLRLYFSRLNNPTSLSFSYIECSDHPYCHQRDSFSMTVPFLHWAAKILDRALQKWSYKSWIEVVNHFPGPTDCIFTKATRDAVGLLCCKGTLVVLVHLAAHLDHQVIFIQSWSQLFIPQPVLVCDIILPEVQGLHVHPWPLWGSCQTITAAWAAPSESQPCPPLHWLLLLCLSATCKFMESCSSCHPKSHTSSRVLPSQSWRNWPEYDGHCIRKSEGFKLFPLLSRTWLLQESSSKQPTPSPTAASIISFLQTQ